MFQNFANLCLLLSTELSDFGLIIEKFVLVYFHPCLISSLSSWLIRTSFTVPCLWIGFFSRAPVPYCPPLTLRSLDYCSVGLGDTPEEELWVLLARLRQWPLLTGSPTPLSCSYAFLNVWEQQLEFITD